MSLRSFIGVCIAIFVILLLGYPMGYFVLDTKMPPEQQNINTTLDQPPSKAVGAYIINLENSKERYKHIQQSVNSLGIKLERIPAINGDTLSQIEMDTKADLESYEQILGHLPNLGTIGCSLSHIKTWQTFLNSNFAYALIFEDDVSFDYAKLLLVIEQLIQNNKLWDITSFDVIHAGTPLTIKNFSNNQRLVVYLTEVANAGAYILNRKAATKLLEKALPIKMPVDHYFTRVWEFNLKFTGIEPRLVRQTFGTSDIGYTKRLKNHNVSTVFRVKFMIYKLHSYLIRFLYNLKIYIASKITFHD